MYVLPLHLPNLTFFTTGLVSDIFAPSEAVQPAFRLQDPSFPTLSRNKVY